MSRKGYSNYYRYKFFLSGLFFTIYQSKHSVKLSLYCLMTLSAVTLLSCSDEIVPEAYYPSNAHDAYKHSLEQVKLSETAIGGDWIEASQNVLSTPMKIDLPFQEAFYIDSTSAFASAYRFEVLQGQKVDVKIEMNSRKPVKIFIDLFRITGDTVKPFLHIASAGENDNRLEFEPRRNAHYIVRLHPELLRGGICKVTIRRMPSVEFPVSGKNESAIGSFFGVPRDGGRREHHGVDVFAARHTPVIAPAPGYIRYVGNRGIGGNVVWLYDSKRFLNYYFAHLQTQNVERYQNVEAGDTLGTVGNTGNARTTPPHLHIGIYVQGQGPVDPYYFITQTDTIPDRITADENLVGKWVRNSSDSELRLSGGRENGNLLKRNSVMKVLAVSKNMCRVLLPDGVVGYLQASQVEPAEQPICRLVAENKSPLKDIPFPGAFVVGSVSSGNGIDVLGEFEGYLLVQQENGKTGWLKI